MVSETYLRRVTHLVFFVGLIFLFTCTFSAYTHTDAHHAGPPQCMSGDNGGGLLGDKFQRLPTLTVRHELSADVLQVKRADLPQQEALPSRDDLWQSLFSRSPPQA